MRTVARVWRSLAGVTFAAGVVLSLTLILGPASGCAPATDEAPGAGRILVTRLEGAVTPVLAEALGNAIDRAELEGYEALVIELDTPGGLDVSTRQMVKRMLGSEVPIIAWVAPSGARAASAGVFITMAADIAAMAPGTNMGAATPVNMQGGMDSTMARKVTNDTAAFARTIANQRGRNAEWAEDAVRKAVSVSETEALELDVIDLIANTLPELFEKSDGLTYDRHQETLTLDVAGLPHDRLEPGIRQRVLSVLADPNIAYILMMLGFYGLMFELQNPGAILPGVVGGICLILAFFALSALPVNYAGLALIALAIVFFVAEIKVASHGLLAGGGIISMLLGSLILFDAETAQLSRGLIIGVTLATAAFFLFIVSLGVRAQKRKVHTGSRGMVGARATAIQRLAPTGQVRFGDEVWNASSESTVEIGTEVEITGVDKLTLRVRPLAKEAST